MSSLPALPAAGTGFLEAASPEVGGLSQITSSPLAIWTPIFIREKQLQEGEEMEEGRVKPVSGQYCLVLNYPLPPDSLTHLELGWEGGLGRSLLLFGSQTVPLLYCMAVWEPVWQNGKVQVVMSM